MKRFGIRISVVALACATTLSGVAQAGFCPLRNTGQRAVTSGAIRSGFVPTRPERDAFEIITGNPIRNADVDQRIADAVGDGAESADGAVPQPADDAGLPTVVETLKPPVGGESPGGSFDGGTVDESVRGGEQGGAAPGSNTGGAARESGGENARPIPSPGSAALALPGLVALIRLGRRR
ncbi:MAG: hypothetical protein SF069_16925 [Phycisphaerae bacterium]|nr:hypothetical protein [Phycisphaerae bacterium]